MNTASLPNSAVERFREALDALIGPSGHVGVAVSGGPDSVALLLLAHAARPGAAEAATVDHGLRPEGAAEAEQVASLCRALNVPHVVLRPPQPITGNLQAAARRVRYRLLEQWRSDRGLDWILTGHHADDQAETLLMRLNRGAGVGGLAGVRLVNAHVARPLLGWRKADLEAIVVGAGVAAADDPSNRDDRFDRARLRRNLAGQDWLDPAALARSAAALAEADDALEWATDRAEAERLIADGAGCCFDPAGLPAELRRRLVLRALRRINREAAPRGDELSRLIATLQRGAAATLAGIKATGGATWRFEPELPRRSG